MNHFNDIPINLNFEPKTPARQSYIRALLSADVTEFVAQGGEIEQVPEGVSGIDQFALDKEISYWFYMNPTHV